MIAIAMHPDPPIMASASAADDAKVDEALLESFPASDAPSWTLGVSPPLVPEVMDASRSHGRNPLREDAGGTARGCGAAEYRHGELDDSEQSNAPTKGTEMRIRFRIVDSVLDEIQGMQGRVAERAQRIFRERGGAFGNAIDDWLKAERETVWRPPLEVRRTKDAFLVEAAAAGLDPKQFDVRVTPTELLLAADVHHSDHDQDGEIVLCEFVNGPLFRSYKFPEPIDPSRVSAEYRNGLLRITAPLAQPATKVKIQAA
jgi:HSP20 family protein